MCKHKVSQCLKVCDKHADATEQAVELLDCLFPRYGELTERITKCSLARKKQASSSRTTMKTCKNAHIVHPIGDSADWRKCYDCSVKMKESGLIGKVYRQAKEQLLEDRPHNHTASIQYQDIQNSSRNNLEGGNTNETPGLPTQGPHDRSASNNDIAMTSQHEEATVTHNRDEPVFPVTIENIDRDTNVIPDSGEKQVATESIESQPEVLISKATSNTLPPEPETLENSASFPPNRRRDASIKRERFEDEATNARGISNNNKKIRLQHAELLEENARYVKQLSELLNKEGDMKLKLAKSLKDNHKLELELQHAAKNTTHLEEIVAKKSHQIDELAASLQKGIDEWETAFARAVQQEQHGLEQEKIIERLTAEKAELVTENTKIKKGMQSIEETLGILRK